MLASCDHCFAEYELDDAKIPAGGARLRCTGCDHYFVIVPPELSDQQSAEDLARDALSTEVPGDAGPDPVGESAVDEGSDLDAESEPESASDEGSDLDADREPESASDERFDLDAESEPELGSDEGFDLDADSEPESTWDEGFDLDGESELELGSDEGFDLDAESEGEASPNEDFDPDGESDWEFNDQVEMSEPEVVDEAPESAFDRDGEWGELATADDVVDDLLGSTGAIDTDAASAVDDLLGELDSADSQQGESSGEPTSGPELPSAGLDLGDAEALDGFGRKPAAAGGDSSDDLSDWELFDQPAGTDASAASGGPKSLGDSAYREGARAEPRVEIAVAMAGDSAAAVRWTDRISEIAGWGAVLLMMIVGLVGGLASNSSEARAPAESWSGAGFEVDQIAGRWVDNAVAGSIYVVSGRIRGAPGSDRASQKGLGIRLLDTTGREIKRDPIPLGPEVPERLLRESSPAEIEAFQKRRAGRVAMMGANWIPFEVLLTDLPQFVDRFELQPLDR